MPVIFNRSQGAGLRPPWAPASGSMWGGKCVVDVLQVLPSFSVLYFATEHPGTPAVIQMPRQSARSQRRSPRARRTADGNGTSFSSPFLPRAALLFDPFPPEVMLFDHLFLEKPSRPPLCSTGRRIIVLQSLFTPPPPPGSFLPDTKQQPAGMVCAPIPVPPRLPFLGGMQLLTGTCPHAAFLQRGGAMLRLTGNPLCALSCTTTSTGARRAVRVLRGVRAVQRPGWGVTGWHWIMVA